MLTALPFLSEQKPTVVFFPNNFLFEDLNIGFQKNPWHKDGICQLVSGKNMVLSEKKHDANCSMCKSGELGFASYSKSVPLVYVLHTKSTP